MSELNRRQFVAAAAVAACACVVCPSQLTFAEGEGSTVNIGLPSDFTADGPVDTWIPMGFIVVRKDKKLYAVQNICTHKGGKVRVSQDHTQLYCPVHRGQFDLNGIPLSGPPKRTLARFGIFLNAKGEIIVDRATVFLESQFDDHRTYLDLSAPTTGPSTAPTTKPSTQPGM